MRRSLLMAIVLVGCQNPPPPPQPTLVQPQHQLTNFIDFANPSESWQIDGLWEIENKAWRWSSGKFSVRLAAPVSARGSTLRLTGNIPEAVIAQNKETTLTCTIGGTALPGETFTKVGDFTLVRDVPPLSGGATLDCSVSKVIPPGQVDKRELGVIVKSVRLDAK